MVSSTVIAYAGLTLLGVGAIFANLAVSKMAKIVKTHFEVGYKNDEASRRNIEIIRKYRETHNDGPLSRDLKIAYWVCGIGAAAILTGILIHTKI